MTMVSLQVPDSFKYSYERFESYPGNLVGQNSYVGSINGYTKRLDSAAPKLFATKEVDVDVPFRDLRPSGLGIQFRFLPSLHCANLRSTREGEC